MQFWAKKSSYGFTWGLPHWFSGIPSCLWSSLFWGVWFSITFHRRLRSKKSRRSWYGFPSFLSMPKGYCLWMHSGLAHILAPKRWILGKCYTGRLYGICISGLCPQVWPPHFDWQLVQLMVCSWLEIEGKVLWFIRNTIMNVFRNYIWYVSFLYV